MASTSSTPSDPIQTLPTTLPIIRSTSPALQDKVVIISTPQDGDSLEMLASKVDAISEVVNANRSIAVATNFKGLAYHSLEPVSITIQGPTPLENDMYNDWKDGDYVLPLIDWQSMTEPPSTGKDSRRRNKARLKALRIIFFCPEGTEQNLAYITKHCEDTVLPLVRAVARVEKAKRHLSGNQDVLTTEEWAEMQRGNEINTAARRIAQKSWIDINAQHASARAALNVLQVRHQAMSARLQGQRTEHKGRDDMLRGLEKSLDKTLEE